MVKLTEQLIRKKAEHHDGPLTTLEELTLHQLELERIEPVLGSVCRKLRILYLQNNIIPKFENLHHMKDIRYLNMGLNPWGQSRRQRFMKPAAPLITTISNTK